MLLDIETWPLTWKGLQRLQRSGGAVVGRICSVGPDGVALVGSGELLAKPELEGLDLILRERRLPWFWWCSQNSM